MKIVVCIKRVPDTAAKIRIDSSGQSIDASDVQYVISPYDEFAIEEAVQIKERDGASEVTVICYGSEPAQQDVRKALAFGADQGVHIVSDGDPLDPFAAARNLADAIRPLAPDLVLFGRQAADGQSGQVGPMTARLLGLPCVTDIVKLEFEGANMITEREVEGGRERCRTRLPAAVTTQKGLNDPRYPSLKGIMAAKKKNIARVDAKPFDAGVKRVSLELPPPRPAGKIVGEGVDAVPELVRLLREEAKVI
ncbi:MAG: electron transfer flavoprotein beta subunit/FixA family protein [Planctomycetota bacterium]